MAAVLAVLRPSDEKFQTCILAAFCALCNDGLAVMIGFLLERKKVFWAMNKTLTRAELMPHLFPHFRSIVLPEIRKRIEGEVTFDRVRDAFAEILLDYLDAFTLAPQLVAEGFTRCRKMSGEDRELDAFFAFLLTRELAKKRHGCGYFLLTSRAGTVTSGGGDPLVEPEPACDEGVELCQFEGGALPCISVDSEIRFTDVDGNVFRYRVAGLETLSATAVEEMTCGEWDLTLFTCTMNG